MERKPSAASLPTDLACTTCQAMFGSGARIGIAVRTTHRAPLPTPQDPRPVRTICCAAVVGAAPPAAAARRGATAATCPTASSTASGSVSSGLRRTSPQLSLRIRTSHLPLQVPRSGACFHFPFSFFPFYFHLRFPRQLPWMPCPPHLGHGVPYATVNS